MLFPHNAAQLIHCGFAQLN